MSVLISVLPVIVPLLAAITPGIVLAKTQHATLPGYTARTILWSITTLTLGTLAVTFLHLPVELVGLLAGGYTLFMLLRNRAIFLTQPMLKKFIMVLTPLMIIYALFALPYLSYHDGLPTGDSQKAIIWGTQILQNNAMPSYAHALLLLNRDPVDFYTPGLHTLTALIMGLSPGTPLTAVGFFAIMLSIAAAVIAGALAHEVLASHPRLQIPGGAITILLVLTNLRFLRYVREPGYHLQNVAGELLLFGMLLLGLALLRRWNWNDALLVVLTGITLALTHQFSAFLAPFALAPVLVVALTTRRHTIAAALRDHNRLTALGGISVLTLIASGFALGLHHKIPHIFTTAPHLLGLVPTVLEYPHLTGTLWFVIGILGLALLIGHTRSEFIQEPAVSAFSAATLVLLILSQGPRLGIDIPPVRTLFYSIIPLSITGAYASVYAYRQARRRLTTTSAKVITYSIITLILVAATLIGTKNAYHLSHTIRTNSTLTPGQLALVNHITNTPRKAGDAILYDDYNRRSSSWLVLTQQPAFARLAADLERQMNEAQQSPLRSTLYLKQLDYEKIIALGSRPEVTDLLRKHGIRWITGIARASGTSLSHNPKLKPVAYADDITLYEQTQATQKLTDTQQWLLKPTTLVNDIGDKEDAFLHLPASLRATRLSDPKTEGAITYRTTSAPLIPLTFNGGQYVAILWDQEHTNRPDTALELYIEFTQAPDNLTIQTATGATMPLTPNKPLRITATDVPFDDDGAITLTIQNPTQAPVGIDLIALGSARTL